MILTRKYRLGPAVIPSASVRQARPQVGSNRHTAIKQSHSMKICDKEIKIAGRLIRIGRLRAEQFETLSEPSTAIEAFRKATERVDVFTFVESLAQTSPRYGFATEWDNLAALRVSTYDHWFTKQINGKTRNMVRRADKSGVVVREVPFDDSCVRGISAVYNESEFRQGKRFSHYQKDLETVRRENGTFLDRSVFVAAFLGTEIIGFAKVVANEKREQAGLMQIVAMVAHRDKATTNALVAQAVRSCADRGIPNLFYSHFAYGKKASDALSDFKSHNGFERVDLPRYYVPLTLRGRVALRMRFHHLNLIDVVPAPWQARLRTLRARRAQWSVASRRSS